MPPPPPPKKTTTTKKAIANKYCYRQAELGIGDCGGLRLIPGMTSSGKVCVGWCVLWGVCMCCVLCVCVACTACVCCAAAVAAARVRVFSLCLSLSLLAPTYLPPPAIHPPTRRTAQQKTPKWLADALGVEVPAPVEGEGKTLRDLLGPGGGE